MLRVGLNQHIAPKRKPIALKPLPQFEQAESSSAEENLSQVSTKYSSTYGLDDDTEKLLRQNSPNAQLKHSNSTNRLPPKEFSIKKRSRRMQIAFNALLFSFLFLTIFIPLYITRRVIYPLSRSAGNLPYFDCTYPGYFSFQGIDVPWGTMTFAHAKWIDLAFNTIIGRGLQTILAFLCYQLFGIVLMSITESNRVSYSLYEVLALAPAQFDTIIPTFKSLFSKLPGSVKIQLFWLFLTSIYVALFPTMIDSISGYQAIQSTMFKLPNQTMVNTPLRNIITLQEYDWHYFGTEEKIQRYVPPNGTLENVTFSFSLIGSDYLSPGKQSLSPSPAIYGVPMNLTSNPFQPPPFEANSWYVGSVFINNSATYVSVCINETASSIYSLQSQAYSTVNGSITNMCLAKNVTNYGTSLATYADSSCVNWYHLQDRFVENAEIRLAEDSEKEEKKSHLVFQPCTPSWNISYFYDSNNYECVSGSNLKYQWGFSYEFLLLASCINGFWLLGSYAIYIQASSRSQLRDRKFGMWRGVLDLGDALREDLGTQNCAYGDNEIDDVIKGLDKKGVGVKYGIVGPSLDDEEMGDSKGRLRLELSSSAQEGRIRVQRGMVYG